jgi:hypothetical protein
LRISLPELIAQRLLAPLLTYQLRRSLGRLGVTMKMSSRPLNEATTGANDITICRRNGLVEFALPPNPCEMVFESRESITAFLYLLSHCPPEVERLSGACDDGHRHSAARFAPSSRSPRIVPLPDRYFILRNGFMAERRLSEQQPIAWADRRSTLVWRGGLNGMGIHPQVPEDEDNPRVIQRARLCMKALTITDTDVRLVEPASPKLPSGMTAPGRREAEWLGDKYAIDIDGWTNAWSNLITRLHFGCCVLKVASADSYRQWWYDRLVPWKHYVPVSADIADLEEKIDWVRTNDREAEAIARNGQALARSMTLETETAVGVELITRNWNSQ